MRPQQRFCGALSLIVPLIVALLTAVAVPAGAATDSDRELEAVRERLKSLKTQLSRDAGQRDKLTRRLERTERLIGSVSTNLDAIRTERSSTQARRKALLAERDQQRKQLVAERDALAGQLRTAYVNGRRERLKMLLNQQDPAALGRLMVFYRYLNGERVEKIEQVSTTLERIVALERDVALETARLETLEKERSAELVSLEKARGDRREVLAALDKRIAQSGTQIAGLEKQQARLVELIAELQARLAEFPVEADQPFASLRGKLAWPLKGRLLGDFGQPRAGRRVRWDGVLVGAERGTEIRAIAHGRVAYADWLPGLGLLVVLEHGDGYLSLYGHNQSITRRAGEWVDAGAVVATVGDSGGQARPALYFELRKKRQPLNPHRWFAGRPAAH